jgi:hypothetical protein
MKDKYLVLQERTVEQLEKTVNAAIKTGYEPLGGVAVHAGQGVSFVQAMLLTESKKPGE